MGKKKTPSKPSKGNDIMPQLKEEFKRHTNVLMEKMDSTVKTVTEQHTHVVKKVDGLRSDVDELKSDMAIVKPVVEQLAKGQKELKSDLSGVKSDLKEVKSELHTVEAVVTENSGDIKGLKADVKGLKEGQDDIKHLVQNHEQRLQKLETT